MELCRTRWRFYEDNTSCRNRTPCTSQIQLSERDFERFAAAITASKPPTAELVAAMQEYEKQRALEPEGNW
jgi:hypothetical protein